jgi:hypothetical protein
MTADTAQSTTADDSPISLQRIPASVDPFGAAGAAIASTLTPFRTAAVTKIYLGMQQIQDNLSLINGALAAPPMPAFVVGSLAQPDGATGANLQVQFDPATVGATGPVQATLTADDGTFTLAMPTGATVPSGGLSFVVHGADANATVTVAQDKVATNGLLGTIMLPSVLSPLPVSILAALEALVPTTLPASGPPQPQTPPNLPKVTIGDEDACSQSFAAAAITDSFPFGVFFRLVEPQMSIVNQVTTVPVGKANGFIPLPLYATAVPAMMAASAAANGAAAAGDAGTGNAGTGNAGTGAGPGTAVALAGDPAATYTDRVPVEQPLSADGFLDQIAGIDPYGNFTADENVPMAATLGLGYVLWMSQQWTFKGLGLGDLVYSLPLAPGEQTEVAVFERTDTSQVFESESFSEQQAEQQSALSDTSTQATFNSAFNEAASGGSAFQAQSDSSSWGGSLIVVSGGGGSSSSSGSGSEWLQGQRDSAQQAAQTTQSSAESQASARRSASRTGMRLATATESDSVTTKTITNHNHTRALTMQYWQVLRMFDVSMAIDGLTLTCLIPMQIVRFMPPGQPQGLTDPTQVGSRPLVLQRYASIVKHLDVLQAAVPRQFQPGLAALEQFASDPTAEVEPEGGVAEDVIQLTLTGSFVACETVTVTAVTKRNTRVGPVQLASTAGNQPVALPPDTFISQDDLLSWLLTQRQAAPSIALQGKLALPASMSRADIVGFEITRNWNTVSYTLASPLVNLLTSIESIFGDDGSAALQNVTGQSADRTTITLTSAALEPALGGPAISSFAASIEELAEDGSLLPDPPNETYASDTLSGTVLPLQPYPVPALQVAPVLRYDQILQIERAAQHVVRNTTLYSQAVCAGLTRDERAILLDGYTIGVPPDGVSDASQLVPLLNCVQNKLLGFFGNSMIMPFIIPQAVADSMGIDPAKIQQALLAYQQATFTPPQSTIALPTQGVLGEGVLGHCPSAEKIDLTRFWNWQDAPADTAPAISPVAVPTTGPSIAAGLTAPNSLANLPSLINNVLQAPPASTGLAQSLAAGAAAQPDFSASLTGAAQLAPLVQNAQNQANSARAQALQVTQALNSQAMATAGDIVGGMFGSPNAGSNAAKAVKGGSTSSSAKKTKSKKTTSKKSSGSGQAAASSGLSDDAADDAAS